VYGLGPEDCLREGEIPSAAAVVADKFKLGRGTFGMSAYRGPGPIADHGPHAYYFQIFALDCALSFAAAPRKKEIVAAMKGYVLAKGVLVGTYERRSGQ